MVQEKTKTPGAQTIEIPHINSIVLHTICMADH